MCSESFTIPADILRYDINRRINKIKYDQVYEVLTDLIPLLDDKYGQIKCTRECGWNGHRIQLREHYQECSKSYRFKCNGCSKIFNMNGIRKHLINNVSHKNCYY